MTGVNDVFGLTLIVSKHGKCCYKVSINETMCIRVLQEKGFVMFAWNC